MGVLFLPPSDAYVRSFLYLLYTLIKLYYTKALSDPASSLAPDWVRLLRRPRIPASYRSATAFQSPWNSPGQNTGVGSLYLLQGIFPTQGSNPRVNRKKRDKIKGKWKQENNRGNQQNQKLVLWKDKIVKSLMRVTKKTRKTQINNIRNESGVITPDPMDIKKIMK